MSSEDASAIILPAPKDPHESVLLQIDDRTILSSTGLSKELQEEAAREMQKLRNIMIGIYRELVNLPGSFPPATALLMTAMAKLATAAGSYGGFVMRTSALIERAKSNAEAALVTKQLLDFAFTTLDAINTAMIHFGNLAQQGVIPVTAGASRYTEGSVTGYLPYVSRASEAEVQQQQTQQPQPVLQVK